jgi:prevent-host-death family protein
MPGSSFNIHQAKTHFSRLVERAEAGEEIVIARNGEPVARLGPLPAADRRQPGSARGQVVMSDDFDAPDPELERLVHGD